MFGTKKHFDSGFKALSKQLKEMEDRMVIKVSELKGEVAGLRSQVTKIWGEQQTKYDELKKSYDELAAQLENAELPADVVQDIADFKAELKAFDDTIPDTTA